MGNLSSANIQFKKIPDTPGFFFTFLFMKNKNAVHLNGVFV